jgi:hypothetical protein
MIRRNDYLTGYPLLGAGAVHHIKSRHYAVQQLLVIYWAMYCCIFANSCRGL